MHTIKRYIMTLAALFALTAGAWAQETYTVTFKANGNTKTVKDVTLPRTFSCDVWDANGELDLILKELYGWSGPSSVTFCDYENTPSSTDPTKVTAGKTGSDEYDPHYITINEAFDGTVTVSGKYFANPNKTDYSLEISFSSDAPEGLDVAWNYATKSGSFTSPAGDVTLTPVYAPVAAFDLREGSDDKLPEAVEGIYAGTTDAIVTAGSCAQGTLMYAVGTSATEAPALTAFSSTLPTAETIADGGDVYVWYYIKGADAPEGETPTAENTFNDSEISAEPITVSLLNNRFDINLSAANGFTFESGAATATAGTDALTPAEGKLPSVKMGSMVKITAKEGYKISSITVKTKTEPEEPVNVNVNSTKTEAMFTMPVSNVTMTYNMVRDMSVAMSVVMPDGIPVKKDGDGYILVDEKDIIPVVTDIINPESPVTLTVLTDYILSLQKKGDGEQWTDVTSTEIGPGTFRYAVTGAGNYNGIFTSSTFDLYEQSFITFEKGYTTHYYNDPLVLDQPNDALKFYAVTAVSDVTVTLTEVEAKAIPAETPFVAYNSGAEAITVALNLMSCDDVTNAVQFKGSAEEKSMSAQSGCYVLRNGDSTPTFRLVEGAGTLPAHRCWIELGTASSARALGVEFDGTKTAISTISVDADTTGDWYDLQGRKLQNAPQRKGTYIHNGKTIIIK